MEQSRRAVESYWRSRMVDGATSDEDKVTPVYKLEEICDLLRSSHPSIVREVAEFVIKRLDHKSPIVKQKALRLIKYVIAKSGAEFRREMQRNSIAIRQLIHYRGQPDPLKGDAPNKAVRETAQEALSALFSTEESNTAPKESNLGSRIQGFGNTNYEVPSDDRRSFINDVVNIGNATIKHGLNSLTQSPSLRKNNDTGTYRSPNLRRSLTGEGEYDDRYEGINSRETQSSSRFSKNAGSGNWDQDINASQAETSHRDSASTYSQKTREEKLLETIVSSGGVRLQPTRDAIHAFLVEASKLNSLPMAHAIETKLKSPMWQVRMKAVCVLEALLRKKDDDHFSAISSYFVDNIDVVVQCSESPQASLREKANKVLSLLGGNQNAGVNNINKSAVASQPSMIPDLIDTNDSNDFLGIDDPNGSKNETRTTDATGSSAPLIDDLFGDNSGVNDGNKGQNLDDDPFADVSFHTTQVKDHVDDFFSGVSFDNSASVGASNHRTESEPFDLLNSSFGASDDIETSKKDISDLMGSLSVNGNNGSTVQKGPEPANLVSGVQSGDKKAPINVLNNEFVSQASEMNGNPIFPLGSMGYNFPPGMMINPALASQQMNYNAMGNLFAQQQLLAAMSNFQQLGNMQPNMSINAAGVGSTSSPYPDVFNSNIATQPPTSLMNDAKRDDTKAFDFINDHLAAARDSKHVN